VRVEELEDEVKSQDESQKDIVRHLGMSGTNKESLSKIVKELVLSLQTTNNIKEKLLENKKVEEEKKKKLTSDTELQ